MNFLQKFAGKISDMIPNEFSKMNSFSKFLPPPFNLAVQAPAALDRFGETYSNSDGGFGSLADAMYSGGSFMGTSGDPNKYSPKNRGFGNDWMMNAGRLGDLVPGPGGQMNQGTYQNLIGDLMMKRQSQDDNFGSRQGIRRNPQIQIMPYQAM
jgi:hypothetical protein